MKVKFWFESFVPSWCASDSDINLSSEIFPVSIPLKGSFPPCQPKQHPHQQQKKTGLNFHNLSYSHSISTRVLPINRLVHIQRICRLQICGIQERLSEKVGKDAF